MVKKEYEKLTAKEYKDLAIKASRRSHDSFDRCDTDGFVSQFCDTHQSRLYGMLAKLAESGWKYEFPALFDLDGNRVNAKLIDGKFGKCWALTDDNGRFNGKFITAFPARKSTMAKKGYVEGKELAPAYAVTYGGGKGFSGLHSIGIKYIRTDGK